jgi:hypothetical protein
MEKETRALVAFYIPGEHTEEEIDEMIWDILKGTPLEDFYLIESEVEELNNEQEVTI